MRKSLVMLIGLLAVFSFILPAVAEPIAEDKQLSTNTCTLQAQSPQTTTGTVEYYINQLSDGLTVDNQLTNTQGSKLKLTYDLNTPANKLGLKWELYLNDDKQYGGDVFIDGSRVIFSKDVINLTKEFGTAIDMPEPETLPQYLYKDDPKLVELWHSTPQFNDLLTFVIEALPVDYFNTAENKVTIEVNKGDLADSALTLTIKTLNNQQPLLNLGLGILSKATTEQDVEVKVPVLNSENSLDLSALATVAKDDKMQAKSLIIFPGLEPRLSVVLNGSPLLFDVQPVIKDGRTMVPVRNLTEALGCKVTQTNDNQVLISKGDKYLMLKIGSNIYTINGVYKLLDVPAYVNDGRTMVPLRFLAEELSYQVNFSGNIVYLTSK